MLFECAMSSNKKVVFERYWSWETNFWMRRKWFAEILGNRSFRITTEKKIIIRKILSVKKKCCHLNLVAFWKFRNLASKMVDIEFCTCCLLVVEATKVVVMLPLFEKEMAKSVSQTNWASFTKFFSSKIVVIQTLLFFESSEI